MTKLNEDCLEYMHSYKDAIKEAMEQKGFTYNSLARSVGKEPSWVWRTLQDKQDSRLSTLHGIAKALGMKWEKPRLVERD